MARAKGFGRNQRKLRGIFRTNPDRVFRTADLIAILYPNVETTERRHLVCALSGADSVAKELGWIKRRVKSRVEFLSPSKAESDGKRARAALATLNGEA